MSILKKCYDRAAAFYGRSADPIWKDRFDRLRKTVRDTLAMADLSVPARSRVLDLGCGSGLAAEEFLRRFPQAGPVTGVDLSPNMGKEAQAGLGEKFTFCCGDYTDGALWQALPSKFNGVLAFYTFHWIPADDLAFVIERIDAALEEQGWLLGIAMGPAELGGIFQDTIPEVLQIYLPPEEVALRLAQWNPKDVPDIESAFGRHRFVRTRIISLKFAISYPTYLDLLSVILFQYSFWLADLPHELFAPVREKLRRSIERDARFCRRNGTVEAPHHVVIFEAHKR